MAYSSFQGAKVCCRANSGCVGLVEKFRSLEVEKDLIIILSTETSLRLIIAIPSCPITAPTSQVGEVAVVRTSVSYKCGWGLDNKKLTPSLTLPAGEGTRVAAQLARSPRPLWEREQMCLSRQAKVTDAGEGLNIILTIIHPNLPLYREGMRCRCSINVFFTPNNRVYLPSWGGRSCANVSELQMRVGIK